MWYQWFNLNVMKLWTVECLSSTRVHEGTMTHAMQEPPFWCRTSISLQTCLRRLFCLLVNKAQRIRVLCQNVYIVVYGLVYARRRLTRKRRNCYFLSKNVLDYLQLILWCHMGYFNDVLNTFLGLKHRSSVAVYAVSESSRISSKIY